VLAIIGGSGLTALGFLESVSRVSIQTAYQDYPVELTQGRYKQRDVLFLARHGATHSIAPHRVNYRANLAALQLAGAQEIIAVNAVGGIDPGLEPGAIAVPDQLIDYTHSRDCTFFDNDSESVNHVDFTYPYDAKLRRMLIAGAQAVKSEIAGTNSIVVDGVYGCAQGPRLETAAEIVKFQRDGCTMVGMTGMPEAVLARELDLAYACIALSVNWGAGIGTELISMDEIRAVLEPGIEFITRVLEQVVAAGPEPGTRD